MKKNLYTGIFILLWSLSAGAQNALYNNGGGLHITSGATLTINGGFTNTGASPALQNNGILAVTGGITNNQTMSTYTGKLVLRGNTTQILGGTADMLTRDLEINNADGITLNRRLKVDGAVTFINGILAATATPLWFTSAATYTGASDAAHVNGYVVKEGTGNFNYPVGDGTRFQQVGVTASANAGGILVKYEPNDAGTASFGTTGASATPLLYYNTKEHWDIHPLSTATGTVTIYWDDYNNVGISSTAHLSVAHKSGGLWLNEGAAGLSGTTAVGSVTSASLSAWSPFTLGSINSLSTLPVHWLSIRGSLTAHRQALMNWQVSEFNVAAYHVEKSTDALQFATIGRLSSKGDGNNSYSFTEADPLSVTTYYRIKQTGINGRYAYSPVIRLQPSGETNDAIAVYPVPFTTGFTITSNKAQKACLINTRGQVLRQVQLNKGANYIHAAELGNGVYYLTTGNGGIHKLVKQ